MKRLISVLLTLSITFSLIPAFAKNNDLISAQSFNNMPTGGAPIGCTTGGVARVAVVKEGREKALELSGAMQDSSVFLKTEALSGIYSFSFDLFMDAGRCATEVFAKDIEDKKQSLLTIDENGTMNSVDGDILGGFGKGYTTRITVSVDTIDKSISVFKNKSRLLYSRYVNDKFPEFISGFGISVKGKEKISVLADNLAIYKGLYVIDSKDIPKSGYSYDISKAPVEIQTNVETQDKAEEPTVFFKHNFENDDAIKKIKLDTDTNICEVDMDLFSGNKYLKHQRLNSTKTVVGDSVTDTTKRDIVYEAKFSTNSKTPSGTLLLSRGPNGADIMMTTYLSLSESGQILLPNREIVGKISKGVWTHVAVAIHIDQRVFDVYIDGELKARDVEFSYKNASAVTTVRSDFTGTTGEILMDDIVCYSGKAPGEIPDGEILRSVQVAQKTVENYFGNMMSVMYYSNTYFKDGQKKKLLKPALYNEEEKEAYLSKEDMVSLFGDVDFSFPHKDNASFYKLYDNAKNLGYSIVNLREGFYLISRGELPFKEGDEDDAIKDYYNSKLNLMYRYMLYDRPTASDIREAFSKTNPGHPRVIVNRDDVNRIKEDIKTDANMAKWSKNIIDKSNALLPSPALPYKKVSNSYVDIEEGLDRVLTLGMAYLLTDDKRYALRCFSEIEPICKLDDWNMQYSFLDTSELCGIVAIGYDWCYDALTEDQRKLAEDAMYNQTLVNIQKSYYEGADKCYWGISIGNWNPVCNGSSTLGAIAMFEKYPELLSDFLSNGMHAMTLSMILFYPDGAWIEGPIYGNYAMQWLCKAIESYENAFGTDLGFLNTPGLTDLGWYDLAVTGSVAIYGYGDCYTGFENYKYMMWCASRAKDSALLMTRLEEMEKMGYEGGTLELIYYDPSLLDEASERKLDYYVRGMEIVTMRQRWFDRNATFLGTHGGIAYRDHGHFDIGTFAIHMAGEELFREIGSENYSFDGYFNGFNRYRYYRARPEGHNLYVINPTSDASDYGIDPDASAKCLKTESKPRGAYAVMDLTESYHRDVTSAKRGYMILDDRRNVLIRDEISLKKESEIYWFAQVKGNIEVVDNNTAYVLSNGKKFKVIISTNADEYEIYETDAAPLPTSPQIAQSDNSVSGFKKLAIKLKAKGDLNINFKVMYAYDEAANEPIYDVPLDLWEIPDGELKEISYPYADAIYADGKLLDGFNKDTWGYQYKLAKTAKGIPQITASSDKYNIEINQATEFGKSTEIKFIDKVNPDISRTYTVTYTKPGELSDVNGMKRLYVSNITSSYAGHEGSDKENVNDGSFSTVFAVDVHGHHVTLELESLQKVDKVAIAFTSGNARKAIFKLEVSENGKSWSQVYEGESSGTTAGYEFFDIGGKDIKYVKFTGFGNNQTDWTNVSEIAVLAEK